MLTQLASYIKNIDNEEGKLKKRLANNFKFSQNSYFSLSIILFSRALAQF